MIDPIETLKEHVEVVAALDALVPDIKVLAVHVDTCLARGGKVLWMGNGGSAADCQHLAAELVGRFRRERAGLPSVALTTDSSILTAVANDYGFEQIFSRQVEALCSPADVVIGISTSGTSGNVLCGLSTAKQIGTYTVALTGASGGEMAALVDLCLCIPSRVTARIQEMHILVGHILCDWVEAAAVGRNAAVPEAEHV